MNKSNNYEIISINGIMPNHFNFLHNNDDSDGSDEKSNYFIKGMCAKQAVNKIYAMYLKNEKNDPCNIIIEVKKEGNNNIDRFKCSRFELEKPVEVEIKDESNKNKKIVYKYKNVVEKIK